MGGVREGIGRTGLSVERCTYIGSEKYSNAYYLRTYIAESLSMKCRFRSDLPTIATSISTLRRGREKEIQRVRMHIVLRIAKR